MTVNSGFVVQSIGPASGGLVLQAGSSAEQRASYGFTATDGLYEVKVGYFDENDGVATLALRVNGVTLDSRQWNQDIGSPMANGLTDTVHTIQYVEIRAGNTVEIVC
jgi:hypothetical protein